MHSEWPTSLAPVFLVLLVCQSSLLHACTQRRVWPWSQSWGGFLFLIIFIVQPTILVHVPNVLFRMSSVDA